MAYRSESVCREFPNYTMEFSGVGVAPPSCTNDVGPCSQIAIFTRQGQMVGAINIIPTSFFSSRQFLW